MQLKGKDGEQDKLKMTIVNLNRAIEQNSEQFECDKRTYLRQHEDDQEQIRQLKQQITQIKDQIRELIVYEKRVVEQNQQI